MGTIIKIGSLSDRFKAGLSDFRAKCLNPNSEILELKTDYNIMQDMFVGNRQIEEFCDNILELSERLNTGNHTRIRDFLITQLCKLCIKFNMNERAEILLCKAVEYSRQKNDGMHELARLIDLEKLYREENSRKDLYRILKEKKDCCKRVLATYDEQCKNFDTIVTVPTSKESISIQLAYAYSDLASMLERHKTLDAIKLYEKTRDIYSSIGRLREVAYLQEKIHRIRVRNNLYC